jgi:hypothetical protein
MRTLDVPISSSLLSLYDLLVTDDEIGTSSALIMFVKGTKHSSLDRGQKTLPVGFFG